MRADIVEGSTYHDRWPVLAEGTLCDNIQPFDLRQDVTINQFSDPDVILTGASITLYLDAGDNPGTDWTSFSMSMALGCGWKIDTLYEQVATEAEIRAVLADLQSFQTHMFLPMGLGMTSTQDARGTWAKKRSTYPP